MNHLKTSPHPLVNGIPPDWACGWGEDEFGVWAEFKIKTTIQKMRWIPSGKFLMGSQKHEKGHYASEAPQHQVIIPQGYWLFNTPVTQALWEAVMQDNPSRFKTPNRPVEQVTWNDCQDFIKKLNTLIPGVVLSLPSESQWEYACRAGSQIATYPVLKKSDGKNNNLNEIAWYSDNSWNYFEFRDDKKSTYPVAGKLPNQWGLYDMLGNVWEWTEDSWHDNYNGAPANGKAWIDSLASTDRVIRGGGWNSFASICRSAYRLSDTSANCCHFLGFRCVGYQSDKFSDIVV